MRNVKILKTIAFILLLFQLFSYLGSSSTGNPPPTDPAGRVGYYFGFNLAIIIAVILFISAASLKKKLKRKEIEDTIDSIGKPENIPEK